jgi:hypothetical protein
MKTPASTPIFSTRPFPTKIAHFDCGTNLNVLKVSQNGAVKWASYYWVYVFAALKGK